MAKTSKKSALIIFSILFSLLIVGTAGIFYFKNRKIQTKTEQSSSRNIKDKYVSFLFEVYDTIQKNYWDKIKDEQLINLYLLGAEKLTGKKRWAMIKTVRSWEIFQSESWIRVSDSESRLLVASSKIMIFGRDSIILAIASRCFWPPESLIPLSPTWVSYLSGRVSIN